MGGIWDLSIVRWAEGSIFKSLDGSPVSLCPNSHRVPQDSTVRLPGCKGMC